MKTARGEASAPDPEMLQATKDIAAGSTRAPWLYLCAGIVLGVIFVKSEVLSWYRIQEMFRFQGFRMYGVIGSALLVATASVQMLHRNRVCTLDGELIAVPPKHMTPRGVRYWAGGTLFGLGWGLLGACPGRMFALIGAGVASMTVAVLSAMAGTWVYGALQSRLPH